MISVCMATYNGEKFIKEQISSILKQLSLNDELIISDDGSTDNTIKIINDFNDSRIKLVYNEGVHGFVGNFENSLKYANGDYIFLADQDDVWVDNKVEICCEYLKKYDFVVHDCYQTNEDLSIYCNSRFEKYSLKRGYLRLYIKMRFIGCCMAFTKRFLKICLPFPKKHDLLEHDTWIVSVAERYFKYQLISDKLLLYRRHGNNTSDGGEKSKNSLFNKIYRRIYRFKEISKLKKKFRSETK